MSFFTNKNECCHDNYDNNAICAPGCCCVGCRCCPDGDCHFILTQSGKKNYAAAFAQLLFIIFFAWFKAVRACGKHTSRLVALIILLLVNLTNTILGFISGYGTFTRLIAIFSLLCALCNLLGLILPNCASCENLTYDDNSSFDNQMNEVDSSPKQLFIIPSQNDEPPSEEALPKEEEAVQETIGKPVDSNCIETNPGYDSDDKYSVNSLEPAVPINMVQDNNCNNQENDLYPKPQ